MNYTSPFEIVTYRGHCVWRLKEGGYPWHAFVEGEHKDYDTLEEAKADIDREQEEIHKWFINNVYK